MVMENHLIFLMVYKELPDFVGSSRILEWLGR